MSFGLAQRWNCKRLRDGNLSNMELRKFWGLANMDLHKYKNWKFPQRWNCKSTGEENMEISFLEVGSQKALGMELFFKDGNTRVSGKDFK